MSLTQLFNDATPCIVAYVNLCVKLPIGVPAPALPEILGTGFFVNGSGLTLTNRHVIEALHSLPRNPITGGDCIAALVFGLEPEYVVCKVLPIHKLSTLVEFRTSGDWYGRDVPDVGFVQLTAAQTPYLELADEPFFVEIGMEVATMGFPLGSIPLGFDGRISQITPFIRRGIVSSVYPLPTQFPHGFTIDIMQQGGSSGSPIFRGSSTTVVGLMKASFIDTLPLNTPQGIIDVPTNTNISLAEPSVLLKEALKHIEGELGPLPNFPTLESLLSEAKNQDGKQRLDWMRVVGQSE